jgi:galactitol-specific phosphotransferase system IIB component
MIKIEKIKSIFANKNYQDKRVAMNTNNNESKEYTLFICSNRTMRG